MARNLLGEKKENGKEGCEGRKTDHQTVREERESQNSLDFINNREGALGEEESQHRSALKESPSS